MNPEALSAKFKNSFAYFTVKDRLPVILAKIVDTAFRQRHEIHTTLGEKGGEDLKYVTHALSELRYRITTDKPLTPIVGQRSDVSVWNKCLHDYEEKNKCTASWFKSPWLLVECYMYRKIVEAFETSNVLQSFDPFRIQKNQAFVGALPNVNILADHTKNLMENCRNLPPATKKDNFSRFLQLCLWGNKCDLSISSGENSHHVECPLEQVDQLKSNILVDDTQPVYDLLTTPAKKCRRIDIILDNAGLEFFGDLCLAEYLLSADYVELVVFHVKSMPWFVSDVTTHDFTWTLEMLNGSESKNLQDLGRLWYKRQGDGTFVVKVDDFWTLPYSYGEMQSIAPDLYKDLQSSDFVIFKGDLNYRKLVGDLNWPPTSTFVESLRGFAPAPLVALRTLKADVVVGLAPGVAEKLSGADKDWMISGDYSVIQFYNPK